jgi:hypothetical protein
MKRMVNMEEISLSFAEQLSVDEASRLAVTATVADLEYWAHAVAVGGQIDLEDLVGVLDALRSESLPQQPANNFAAAAAAAN